MKVTDLKNMIDHLRLRANEYLEESNKTQHPVNEILSYDEFEGQIIIDSYECTACLAIYRDGEYDEVQGHIYIWEEGKNIIRRGK